jgi:hypothetical protein
MHIPYSVIAADYYVFENNTVLDNRRKQFDRQNI